MALHNRMKPRLSRALINFIAKNGKKTWLFGTKYHYINPRLRVYSYNSDYGDGLSAEILVGDTWIDIDVHPGPWEDDVVHLAAELLQAEEQRALADYRQTKLDQEENRFEKLDL